LDCSASKHENNDENIIGYFESTTLFGMITYIFAEVEDRKEKRQQNIACVVVVDSLH
jgi:hypothetical protein